MDWQQEFAALCHSYGCRHASFGMGLEYFARLLDDKEGACHFSDHELAGLIVKLDTQTAGPSTPSSPSSPRSEHAERIRAEVGGPIFVCVVGGICQSRSTRSEKLVTALAAELRIALATRATFFTTGCPGIELEFAEQCGGAVPVYHLLPAGQASDCCVGKDISAGTTEKQAATIFAQVGDVYITVEEGPGVCSVAGTAHNRGAAVVPVGHSGGCSTARGQQHTFPAAVLERPTYATEEQWRLLESGAASPEEMAAAAAGIVDAFCSLRLPRRRLKTQSVSALDEALGFEELGMRVLHSATRPSLGGAGPMGHLPTMVLRTGSSNEIVRKSGAIYQGQLDKQGRAHGNGMQRWPNHTVYEGDWVRDIMTGCGKLSLPDGSGYNGRWLANHQHGKGTYVAADGSSYTGRWQCGRMHGEGKYTWPDGSVYMGQFKDGIKSGCGHLRWPSGTVYEGQWDNDKEHGNGFCTTPDGRSRQGIWEEGKRAQWLASTSMISFNVEVPSPTIIYRTRDAGLCAHRCSSCSIS